jgi:hypothetical protein
MWARREARIAPRRVLFGHPDHEATDLDQDLPAVDRGPAVRPFPRDELAVPPQQRVGRDDRGDIAYCTPADAVAPPGQPPAIVISQTQAPAAQLTAQAPTHPVAVSAPATASPRQEPLAAAAARSWTK